MFCFVKENSKSCYSAVFLGNIELAFKKISVRTKILSYSDNYCSSVSMCLDDTAGVGDAGAAAAAAGDDQIAGCVQLSFQSLHVSVEPSRHLSDF